MSAKRRGRKPPTSGPAIAGDRQGWRAEVAAAATADAGGLDRTLLGDFLDRLAEPGAGHDWDRHATAAFAALGARAAEQGVALRALVDLYLSAAWRAWPLLPEVVRRDDADAVRAAGHRALRTCDDVVAALAEGYAAARRALVRREESARREFVDDLLAGTADPAGLLARAESYGLQLGGAHVVLLAEASTPVHEASRLLIEVSAALDNLFGASKALVTTRDGRLTVVLPMLSDAVRDAAVTAAHRALAGEERGTQPRFRLAVGPAHSGPSGVARSFTEARDALALAARLRLPDRLVRAADLLVYQVLLRDRAAMNDLIDTVFTPLRQARGGPRPLLDTLQAYLDVGGNTTRAARRLHLSVRAVSYRLDRIAALTGLHPAEPAHRHTLHTALLGARALGWPDPADDAASLPDIGKEGAPNSADDAPGLPRAARQSG